MRRAVVVVAALGALRPAVAAGPTLTATERQVAGRITAAQISAHIRFLADDLLEGRAPGSRGDALTQRYLASQFEAIGLRPGNGKAYLQKVPLVGVTTGAPGVVKLKAKGKGLLLRNKVHLSITAGDQQPRSAIRDAEVVFVGYGIVAPEYGWNDYAGVDVKGKVVLVMNDDPSDDPKQFAGKTRLWYGRWDYKYVEAARQGAVGAIVIHTEASASYPWSVVQNHGEEFELAATPGQPRLVAKMWASDDASRDLAAFAGQDLDALRARAMKRGFKAVPLGVRLSLALENKLRAVESANVLGVVPGSDPRLKHEAVVFTAHHDHLGIGEAVGGDTIYNGALDNASGVATMLAMAQAAARGPAPRRSLLFLAVAAEEQGLLGSAWYAAHPTFAPGRIAAVLNLDSVNKDGRTTDVGFIGLGKSSLDGVVTEVAAAQGRVVKGDPYPERGFFYRSDQFSFAQIGVPGVYASGGPTYRGRPAGWGKQQSDAYEAKHYHAPSDEYDGSWDLSGAVEDAQLYLLVALRIASADAMPQWHPGDEFEAARQAALRALRK